jgi:hypothetical protein
MQRRRQGCLSGLLQLTFLNFIFNWMQTRFGFGERRILFWTRLWIDHVDHIHNLRLQHHRGHGLVPSVLTI